MDLRDIPLGQYVPGNSLLHRTDPRIKLVGGMVFSVAIFGVGAGWGYGLLALYVAVLAGVARIPLSFLVKGLRPLFLLMVVAAGLHLFFTPGEVWALLGPLTVTREGLVTSGHMLMRLILLLTGISLVTLTTTPLALTDGLERLLTPFRRVGLPAHEIAMMMTIALRFIPTLGEELDRLVKAQLARGAQLEGGGLVHRIRHLVPLLVPLFVAVFRRAEELGLAMEARGYRGGYGRTKMREPVLQWYDWVGLGLHGVVCAVALGWF